MCDEPAMDSHLRTIPTALAPASALGRSTHDPLTYGVQHLGDATSRFKICLNASGAETVVRVEFSPENGGIVTTAHPRPDFRMRNRGGGTRSVAHRARTVDERLEKFPRIQDARQQVRAVAPDRGRLRSGTILSDGRHEDPRPTQSLLTSTSSRRLARALLAPIRDRPRPHSPRLARRPACG
jgi:hypothetical protein